MKFLRFFPFACLGFFMPSVFLYQKTTSTRSPASAAERAPASMLTNLIFFLMRRPISDNIAVLYPVGLPSAAIKSIGGRSPVTATRIVCALSNVANFTAAGSPVGSSVTKFFCHKR